MNYIGSCWEYFAPLEKLKNLTELELGHDLVRKWPEYSNLFVYRHTSEEEFRDDIHAYFESLKQLLPDRIGLGLKVMGILIAAALIDLLITEEYPNLINDVMAIINQNGSILPELTYLTSHDAFADLDVARMLIQHGFDFEVSTTVQPQYEVEPQTVFCEVTSVELFKAIFEEKLVSNKTMTAFEYMQSLHPDFPFFWDFPFFSLVAAAKDTAVRT